MVFLDVGGKERHGGEGFSAALRAGELNLVEVGLETWVLNSRGCLVAGETEALSSVLFNKKTLHIIFIAVALQ